MTTRILSFGTLRNLAAARRRGNLAGNWSNIVDRDLSRTASDLLAVSYDDGAWADPVRTSDADTIAHPVDLDARRSRGPKPATPAPTHTDHHARAS
jgi:hypothetical protein